MKKKKINQAKISFMKNQFIVQRARKKKRENKVSEALYTSLCIVYRLRFFVLRNFDVIFEPDYEKTFDSSFIK